MKPNQTDQDILPAYDTLDQILERIIEHHYSVDEAIKEGFDPKTVMKVYKMIEISEFKRKQAPPGIKITDRAFGSGWRMPIAKKS